MGLNTIQELMKRQRINEEGESIPTTNQCSEDVEKEISKDVLKEMQPKLLSGAVLRDYQLYGVNWITTLYENGLCNVYAI